MQWLAWTGRPDIHWIVPILSGGLFGFAYVLNMVSDNQDFNLPKSNFYIARNTSLQQRSIRPPSRCICSCSYKLHALHGIICLPPIHSKDGFSAGVCLGHFIVGIYNGGYDSYSLGFLQVGSSFEKQESVFEGLSGSDEPTLLVSTFFRGSES